jgi:glycosyltransferase involved in cell wall biosynthesis
MIVNQWVPAAHVGDAVGDHTRSMCELFRSWGHTSEVFAITIDDSLKGDVLPWTDSRARAGDVTVLQFAAPSAMTAEFAALPGTRMLQYHNITPAHFLAPYDTHLARMAGMGRAELASLAGSTHIAAAASEYSRRELEALGFRTTVVAPILTDTERLTTAEPMPALERLLQDGLANILFVGRIAPNKKIEDILRMAEHYKRYVDAAYRFIFVGRTDVVPAYYTAVRALVAEYRMLPERFLFPGGVSERDLATYYRNAHAYVSLSEHEGFCVPLVEAMAMEVPVLAYASTAVPETLGGAGVSFAPKDLEQAAELLGALIYDAPFRAGVLEGQRRRIRDFEPASVAASYRRLLETVTS